MFEEDAGDGNLATASVWGEGAVFVPLFFFGGGLDLLSVVLPSGKEPFRLVQHAINKAWADFGPTF